MLWWHGVVIERGPPHVPIQVYVNKQWLSPKRDCAHSPNTTVKTTKAATIITIAVNTMLLRPYGQISDFLHADDVDALALNSPP